MCFASMLVFAFQNVRRNPNCVATVGLDAGKVLDGDGLNTTLGVYYYILYWLITLSCRPGPRCRGLECHFSTAEEYSRM